MSSWRLSPKSGLYLPTADTLKRRDRQAYASDALAIRKYYEAQAVVLNKASGLEDMLRCAEDFSKLSGNSDAVVSTRQIFDAMYVSEIRRVISTVDGHPKAKEYLGQLIKGKLSYYDTGKSISKDILWELEVCSRLREIGFSASLAEPDVVWDDDGVRAGIACKKIYSEGHVQNVLSQAVKQIKGVAPVGFVAFNIDELIPPGKTLVVSSEREAEGKPLEISTGFLRRHERHFQKYFKDSRLSGVIVSTSCRTKLDRARPGFFINTQWMCWAHPGLKAEHLARAKKLATALARLQDPKS